MRTWGRSEHSGPEASWQDLKEFELSKEICTEIVELPSAVGASDGSRQTRGFVSPRLRDNSDADV